VPEQSTTPNPVERVRDLFDAANRYDLDAVMSFFAPDAVFDMSQRGLGVFEVARHVS
jgi:ketosteroid isomerase-like protein